mmetsp:Transcript_17068/g.41894  ORF Transcript_17068/g.41894 Transcript_17068/m.41894 type:complete len:247 (+) Transcript_17068:173-913(+)
MGRQLVFFDPEAPPEPSDDDTGDKLDEWYEKYNYNVSMGSGDAWPCYWPAFFIAAHRKLVWSVTRALVRGAFHGPDQTIDIMMSYAYFWDSDTSSSLEQPPKKKQRTLAESVAIDSKDSWMSDLKKVDEFLGIIVTAANWIKGRRERSALNLIRQHRASFDRVHLVVFCDIIIMHSRNNNHFSNDFIKEMHLMASNARNFLPRSKDELLGTPWEGNEDHVVDERWDDLVDSLSRAAQKESVTAVLE